MGKKSKQSKEPDREVEPLFTPIKTTDDDDDDDVELDTDGGPKLRYRDDPQASPRPPTHGSRSSSNDDNGPETQFKDHPGSIFDWDDDGDGGESPAEKEAHERAQESVYEIDDFDADASGFSPVSLHDDDSGDDDEERNGTDFDGNGNGGSKDDKIRRKANKLLNQRVFDETTYDDDEDRIFVGGGWGRHGSQFSLCPKGCCSTLCCCFKSKPKGYSYGPPSSSNKGYSTCKLVCLSVAFMALVVGAGYFGYEAGLPVDSVEEVDNQDGLNATLGMIQNHPHNKGEEWIKEGKEWIQHEKEDFHMPNWNFTFHHQKNKLDQAKDEAFKKSEFEPMTQAQLLKLSENVFQSCSERSLKTTPGRQACISLCHGHYCCFEKEVIYGSCVSRPNANCFAYAACENAIGDFEMNNANNLKASQAKPGEKVSDFKLDANDVKLLGETCSKENVGTLDGIRDCTAFCQHHLCCFNELESENCARDHAAECQAYDSCKILVDGPEDMDVEDDPIPLANLPTPAATNPPLHAFKTDCTQSNLYDNWDLCKDHCSRYECCFRTDEPCYEKNALECDEYYICEEFYMDENGEYNPGGGYLAPHNNQVEVNNNDNNGYKQSPYDHSDTNIYKGLETAVQAVCGLEDEHPGEDDSWVAACHALCANYLCCFSTEGTESNCRAEMGDAMCNAYQGCVVLHTTSTTSEPNNSNQGSAVTEGLMLGSLSEDVETKDTNNNGAATSSNNFVSTEEKEQSQIDAVLESCSSKANQDPGVADKCRSACDARSCCFFVGPGNCATMNQEWCDEFKSCEVLYSVP